jgi:hypothetical protein
MELFRVAPYSGVDAEFVVPATFTENTEFNARITDMSDLSVTETTYMGQAGETMTFSFSGLYDNSYRVELWYEGEGIENLLDETYDVIRPYVVPANMAETASEIAEYTRYEEIARAIIDSVIPEGFYYKKKVLETVGLGADYIPLWMDAKKVLSVYENNVLVTDRTYEITKDKTAITEKVLDRVNRDEQARLVLPTATSDIVDANLPPLRGFPNGYDYKFVLEAGYSSVPSDIVKAAAMLIDDIKCGRIDYYQRYITSYNTDQFRLQFDKRMFEGTGNIVVDKILSKYAKSITRLGVL